MKRLWMMTVLSIKDSFRMKAWIPLAIMGVLAWFPMLIGFGYRLRPNSFANNIISNYFQFLTIGIYFSALVLGATSMFLERRACMMFTLPISRTEIVVGKLLGTQIAVGCGQGLGYLVSLGLAVHFNLSGFAHSRLGLVTALTLSFTYLCISIPLGFWLSPVPSALLTYLVIAVPGIFSSLVAQGWITSTWIVQAVGLVLKVAPGQVESAPLSKAFYDIPVDPGDYGSVGRNVLLALACFIVLSALAQRKELSTKS